MSHTTRVKPPRWAVQPHLVDPRWRWFWQRPVILAPFWEGGGGQVFSPTSITGPQVGTLTGVTAWDTGPYGYQMQFSFGGETEGAINYGLASDVFLFYSADDWCCISVFMCEGGWGDERTLWASYGVESNQRQLNFNIETDQNIEFQMNSFKDLVVLSGTTIQLNTWYMAAAIMSSGTAIAAVWDLATGVRLEDGSGPEQGDDGDYENATVTIGARSDNGDNFRGWHAADYLLGMAPTLEQLDQLAQDPFGPFRIADEAAVVYAIVGVEWTERGIARGVLRGVSRGV